MNFEQIEESLVVISNGVSRYCAEADLGDVDWRYMRPHALTENDERLLATLGLHHSARESLFRFAPRLRVCG